MNAQALIFDSVYNPFRGVETYFRVINGSIKKAEDSIYCHWKNYNADEIGTSNLIKSPKKKFWEMWVT